MRTPSGAGISLANHAQAVLANDFVCGTGTRGLTATGIGAAGEVSVSGSAFLFSGMGVRTGSSTRLILNGNNAFTRSSGGNQTNVVTTAATGTLQATNSQWQHCGNGTTCNGSSIQGNDISGLANIGTPQAHRAANAISLSSVSPLSTASEGALVHISGVGFNAIEGVESVSGCAGTASGNTCSPLRGTCVEFENPPGSNAYISAEVISVTPTRIVVRAPVRCEKARKIRVSRVGSTTAPTITFCGN